MRLPIVPCGYVVFYESFPSGFPSEYYDFVNGLEAREPDWEALYPEEWEKACDETLCLKLGATDTTPLIERRVELLRELHGDQNSTARGTALPVLFGCR